MATTRLAMSMALDSLACSQYLNYDYDSILVGPDGDVLGFNEDGVFRLDSTIRDGDQSSTGTAPVVGTVTFARSMCGFFGRKRVRGLTLSGEFDGDMEITVTGDEIPYEAPPVSNLGTQTVIHKKTSRECRGVHLDITLRNPLGVSFALDAADIFIVPQPHRS